MERQTQGSDVPTDKVYKQTRLDNLISPLLLWHLCSTLFMDGLALLSLWRHPPSPTSSIPSRVFQNWWIDTMKLPWILQKFLATGATQRHNCDARWFPSWTLIADHIPYLGALMEFKQPKLAGELNPRNECQLLTVQAFDSTSNSELHQNVVNFTKHESKGLWKYST